MLKKENIAYLIIGFLVMSVLDLGNVLPVALFATALALIGFMRNKENMEKEEADNVEGI